MSDNKNDKPTMPLQPPANVPELRAQYVQELFEYHQKLREWKASREGKGARKRKSRKGDVVSLGKFKEGRADLVVTVKLHIVEDDAQEMEFLLCDTESGGLAIALCAEVLDSGSVHFHTSKFEDADQVTHYIGRIVLVEWLPTSGTPAA